MPRWRARRAERPGLAAAKEAVCRARAAREEATARQPEVSQQAGRLRELRQENHFAESIRLALEGGR